MTKKCLGCGVILQDNNELIEGYVSDLSNDYCRRCFRMKNYGDYEVVLKSNEEYIDILKKIKEIESELIYIKNKMNLAFELLMQIYADMDFDNIKDIKNSNALKKFFRKRKDLNYDD